MQPNTDDRLRFEDWLFAAFVASLSFPSLFRPAFLGSSVQISDLIFLIALFFWVVAVARGLRTIRWSRVYLPLATYAVAVSVSTIVSADVSLSRAKLPGKLYLIGIAVLAFNIVGSTTVFKKILQAWIAAATLSLLLCVIGIILFYAGVKDPALNLVVYPTFGSLPVGNYPRISGFFYFPAMLCNFLSVSWMFAILMISVGWLKIAKFRVVAGALWIVNFFTLTPGIGGIFLSTGWFLNRKILSGFWRRTALILGVAGAAIFLFIASVTFVAYSPTGSTVPLANGEVSPSHRAEAWRTAFATFLQNPVFGRGVGVAVSDARYTDPSGDNQLLADAHNTYLSVLGETGLVGFLAFFSIVGFIVYGLRRKDDETEFSSVVKLCLLIAFADAVFYQGFTGSYEDARHLWALFGIAAAVGVSSPRVSSQHLSKGHDGL